MTAPTALVLGRGAAPVARRVLAGSGRAGLLVLWQAASADGSGQGTPAESEAAPARARGVGGAARRLPWPARPADPAREALASVLGASGEVRRHGGRLVVELARTTGSAEVVIELLAEHGGPAAIAVSGMRDEQVDRVVQAVDEVIALLPDDPAYRVAVRDELEGRARLLSVVDEPARSWRARLGASGGQATVAVLAVLAGLMAVAVALGLVASALGRSAAVQGRADVSALAGAAALRDAQALLYAADPRRRITVAEVRARALAAARTTARANELEVRRVRFEGSAALPTRLTVVAVSAGPRAGDRSRELRATAEVALGAGLPAGTPNAGEYPGPFAVRQGQRMRPDVALAFDRLDSAARAGGHPLVIVSAYRSDAEQAALFRAHPDPKWVAPPGKSLHRLGTELDLGPSSAYAWLAANARRFGFAQRYSWEAWHYGFTRSAGSASVGYRAPSGAGEQATGALPSFVPARYAPMLSRAAQRWSVGAALLGAQLQQESGFNPNAVSPVGAAGIAQFMVGTAAAYGLSPQERFDPAKAIDAQGHLMHDLLRQFASVPLALAAYNAGPARVARCMCVPPIPETQAYVQAILALLGGAGIAAPAGLEIRLVA